MSEMVERSSLDLRYESYRLRSDVAERAYQAEYSGVVQYYRLAYNLGSLGKLKYTAEVSLVKTLASKLRCSCREVYRRYGAKLMTIDGDYKVLMVKVERGPKEESPRGSLWRYLAQA